MQIWVGVNEADVGRITPGSPVTFSCDAFRGRDFTGTVGKVRLNANMSQNVVMYTVEVNTDNPDRTLLPYLTANVHFLVQKAADVLMIPSAALRWTPSSPTLISPGAPKQKDSSENAKPSKGKDRTGTVWLKEGDFVVPLEVKTGLSDGANTAILSDNLHEGQEIVTGETTLKAQAASQNPFLPPVIKR